MAYKGAALTDLCAPLDRGVRRLGGDAVKKVGDDLKRRVEERTPVAKDTAAIRASYATMDQFVGARGGRVPGELKRSWQVGEVEVSVEGDAETHSIAVFTRDPIAPFVEWDTRPHLILPRKPDGVLTIPTADGMVFAKVVHHPGTRGAHMMTTSLAEVAASWMELTSQDWASIASTIWRDD